MNYCNSCPIHHKNLKCIKLGRYYLTPQDYKIITHKTLPSRCELDSYVVKGLSNSNTKATQQAKAVIQKALYNRDVKLLLAILHNSSEKNLQILWQILKIYEERSLNLINPIFISSGSTPIASIKLTKNSIHLYMKVIKNSPLFGNIRLTSNLQTISVGYSNAYKQVSTQYESIKEGEKLL